MSGIEAITCIQLIDACIGIAKTIIDIGRAVHDAQGLPPKLRDLLEKLPAIEELLESAHESCEEGRITEDAKKSTQPILKECEGTLANLRDIIRTACPKDGENRTKRVWKGAKAVFFGRDSQIKKFLVTIQDNLRLLEQKKIFVIGDKLDALQQVTEALADNDDSKYAHTGAGNIIANEGGSPTNYVVSGSNNRQINNPGAYHEHASTHTYNTYLPPERPETPPKPSSNVRFRSDPDFINRDSIFNQIEDKCAAPGSWTALVGLGGVGKSQLAIEYAYRIQKQVLEMWVFWIYASNRERFEQSYRDIADTVKILGREDPKANIFKLVQDWLHAGKRGKWVLILDNIDDAQFLFDESPGGTNPLPLREYLPQSKNGSILITSRNKEAALKLVEKNDIIKVEPMDEAHAIALLEKKLGEPNASKDTAKLVAALEYMPLAIVQAAALISQRAPRFSVTRYLQDFRESDLKQTSLLDYEGGGLRRDREAKNSIIISWQMSFNYIRDTRPSAADLLSLMCFFDRQEIPDSLLHRRPEKDSQQSRSEDDINQDNLSQSSTSNEFEDDLVKLKDLSFISVNSNGRAFQMHSLVQLAMKKWLEANGQLENWKQQFISNLHDQFPDGELESWERCRALFPHVESAAKQQPKDASSLAEWATLLFYAARFSWKIGNYNNTKRFGMDSMEARKRLFGQDAADTLQSKGIVGLAYNLGGEWEIAMKFRLETMETSLKVLGEEHPDTLTSMANLASTYRNQGRWKEAEELEVQVMGTRKRVLGEEHPDTLTSMANLASTYRNQGRWKEAEELFVQVMGTSSRVLGEEHPDTLTSMANLASTYRNQGRWKEAEELFVQVMGTSSRVLGEEHPDTLTSMANLASTYWNQGRWKEAEELFVQVMGTSSRVLGEEHPDTLTSMANLASTYWNQGRWKEAEELFVQVIGTSSRVLGEEHPHTLTSMANLASTYRNQGRWKEAEELEVQVMGTRKRVLGEEHPNTLTSMINLAFTWKFQSRNEEAISLIETCVELQNWIHGTDHPDIATLLEVLGQWRMDDLD